MRQKYFSVGEKFNIKWNYKELNYLNIGEIENKNDIARELEYQAKVLQRMAQNVREDNLDAILELYEDDYQTRTVEEIANQLENYNFEADHLYMEYVNKINYLCENEYIADVFPDKQSLALMFDMGADADNYDYGPILEIKNDLLDILNKTFNVDEAFEGIDLDWCQEMMDNGINSIENKCYEYEEKREKRVEEFISDIYMDLDNNDLEEFESIEDFVNADERVEEFFDYEIARVCNKLEKDFEEKKQQQEEWEHNMGGQ